MNRVKGEPGTRPKPKVKVKRRQSGNIKDQAQRPVERITEFLPDIQPWERENCCSWLAFTDSVLETARHTGLSIAQVQRIATETPEYIIQVRSAIGMVVKQRFERTILVIQDKIADGIRSIPGIPTSEQADSIYTLCKCVALQAENRQVLSGLPESITRSEGNVIDPRAQRESDRRYLLSLVQEMAGRSPELVQKIFERANREAEGEIGEGVAEA